MPIVFIILPFVLLTVGTAFLVNWLIKKSNALRPIAFIISLVSGGISIFCGFWLMDMFLISPFIIMGIGGLTILILGLRSLFKSKQAVINEERENKVAEENRKIEEKNYQSYAWVCQEARRILEVGKIEDRIKFGKLIEVLDKNRSYEELKKLSKELKALEEKENREIYERTREFRPFRHD